MGSTHECRRPVDTSSFALPTRQNIDFSNVDISALSTDVLSTADGFDVREFDQYLPPNSHAATLASPSETSRPSRSFASHITHTHAGVSAATPPPPSSLNTQQPHEDGVQNLQIKTEQMSPDHCNSPSPSSSTPPSPSHETSLSSGAYPSSSNSSSTTPAQHSDFGDLWGSSSYGAFSACPTGLYQYPYFHSAHRSYATPIISSLALPRRPHSPPPGWEQPVYTTLTRP